MRIIISLLFFFVFLSLQAQTITIAGKVADTRTGEGIIANVFIQATSKGIITDLDGNYTMENIEATAKVSFSSLGYETLIIDVQGRTRLDVQLKPSTALLNEIVVTALGLERSTKALGYSVQKLDEAIIAEVKAPNFIDNLSGKVAGLTISQGATGVGSSSKVSIRGEASFTNNNPLFVVDGIPINNNSVLNFTNEAAAGFQEVDFGNGAMEVNADDVASVSVLKGPSAAALYGSRASNGVILITTKDGSQQKGLGISFNSSTFVENAFQLPDFQNKYGQGNSGQFEFVDGLGAGTNDNITYSWGPALDQGTLIAQFDSPVTLADGTIVRGGDVAVHGGAPISPSTFDSHPDNLKDFYQTGVTSINNIAIASAFDKGNARLSFTDLRSESIIPGVNLNRKNVSARLNFKPVEKLNISSSIHYANSRSDNRPANGYGSENINYSLVAWGPRSLDTEQLKDYWQPGLENIQQYAFNYTFFDNPYFILKENKNALNRDRIYGNILGTYQFSDAFSLMFRTGMDYSSESRTFRRAFSTNRFKNGAYAEHNVLFRETNTDVLLNYKKTRSDFSFDLSIGANRMDQKASTVQTQALSLAVPGVFSLSNAASPLEVFQFESNKRINSIYGLAKLAYKDYLYVDITGRNDWSSALASISSTENTSFFYPSVSMSFVASNVLELPEVISFAQLRASWAQVGNDTDPYQTSTAFESQTPFNGQPTFSASNQIANSNLLPEQTTSIELGADIRFLDDRFKLDFSYYNALTKNQIIALPVAISSGYTERVVNGGEIRSQGIEILAGIAAIREGDFKWDVQMNFAKNVTTVESLLEDVNQLTLGYSRVYDNQNQTVWFLLEEGGQVGDIYGTGYLRNDEGQFVIDGNGKYIVDNDLQKLGNYNPDFTLGINNQFRYQNWDMSFFLDWRQGGELVSRTLSLAGVSGQLIETEDRPDAGIIAEGVVNVGTTENPVYQANATAVSAEQYYRQFYDRNHEENNTYDATFVKLRQFSLGYSFAMKQERGIFQKGRKLRLAIVGRNLFAISGIPHFDPEQLAIQGNRFISGVEDMSYATTRSFGFKLGYEF